ncbi:MAG: GNAT family N-acetyltransferase [Candidatus Thorarchaeota archaeon]
MKVYFRELTPEDIPAIKDISKDIWEGDDYIPQIIDEWLQDEDCMNYGTFLNKEKTELIGFGRVKLYGKDIAWLEGGRIKVSYQGQGIGKLQLGYAIEYATKMGVKVAQYDTASDNHASISLAKFYGFKEKKRMELLIAEYSEINIRKKIAIKFQKLTADVARSLYNQFDIGVGDEICIGWSFIPYIYLTDDHGIWIYNKKAILLKIKFGRTQDYEHPSEQEIWLIVYGKSNQAVELIEFTLQKELETKSVKNFAIFCNSEIAELIKKIGFKYPDDEPLSVILFEKTLI